MADLIDKTTIELDIAEKENVANILVSNFASQLAEVVTTEGEEKLKEHQVGLHIASTQLGSFVSNLITENGNMQLELLNLKES